MNTDYFYSSTYSFNIDFNQPTVKTFVENLSSQPFQVFEVTEGELDQDLAQLRKELAIVQQDLTFETKASSSIESQEQKISLFKKRKAYGNKRKQIQITESAEDIAEENIVIKQPVAKKIKATVVTHQDCSSTKAMTPSSQVLNEPISENELNFEAKTSITFPTTLLKSFKGDDLAQLRFSQRNINQTLTNGLFLFENPYDKNVTLFDILRKDGWEEKYKIDAILMPDGKYTSMDNRRLVVAKTLHEISHSIEVFAHSHLHSVNAPRSFLERVLLTSNPVFEIKKNSYGHAIISRMQQGCHQTTEPNEQYGFYSYPIVTTGLIKGRGEKVIQIDLDQKKVSLSPRRTLN